MVYPPLEACRDCGGFFKLKIKIMKFKVGDKVVVKKDNRHGVVISTELNEFDYRVEFEDYTELFYENELHPLPIPVCDLPIKQNRLEELINALNTLGSLGIELDVKITAEINGKKVEL